MFTSKVLKGFIFVLTVLILSACSKSSSTPSADNNETNTSTPLTTQEPVDALNANTPPVATAQTLTTDEDIAKTFTLAGTDADGDALTYEVKTEPVNGTISGNTYTPNPNYNGTDSFTFVAKDGTSDSTEATVSITITAVFDPFITTWKTDNEGSTTSTQIKIGTFSGSTYNFTVEWGDGSKDENVTQSIMHDYATAGTYTVKISGEYPHPFLGNYQRSTDNTKNFDAKKLLSIEQWGDMEWKSMTYAFSQASNMTSNAEDVPNLTSVTSMSHMFHSASSFNQDLSSWDVSSVTDMYGMFSRATSFNKDLSPWDVSSVTSMSFMFYNANSFNQDLNSWDVSSVTNMNSVFFSASSFNQDLSSWDVSAVTNMYAMFRDASSFNKDLNSWDVSSVRNMSRMFRDATSFNKDLSSWDVSAVTSLLYMFHGASSFNKDLSPWDVSSVTDMGRMFHGASSFNHDLSSWDVSSVTNMRLMFYNANSFNQDLGSWDVSSVAYMVAMFNGASYFNQDLNSWDVSAVTDMRAMFRNASSFNQDLSSWDVSAVTDMRLMFYNASSFNQDLGSWDVSSVNVIGTHISQKGMNRMLEGVTLSTVNYDSILTSWSALPNLNSNIVFDGGNSQYSSVSQAARDKLSNDYNWTVTDGGVAP